MACLVKVSKFLELVYGDDENSTPPSPQTITRACRRGELPAQQKGKLWYIDWDIYQKQTGNDLVDKVLRG